MSERIARIGWRRALRRLLPWIIAAVLLVLALRVAPLAEVAKTLRRLTVVQLLALVAANLGIIWLFAARWWIILRALEHRVFYLSLAAYRLAGFGVSYFTPGPQFGGEPLQVALLQARHRVPGSSAVASVTLDKAIELLANFTSLAFGGILIVRYGLFSEWSGILLQAVAFGLLLVPLIFLFASWRGYQLGTQLLKLIPGTIQTRYRSLNAFTKYIEEIECEIIGFCQSHLISLAAAISLSALIWLALLGEYWLMLHFLGIRLDLVQSIIAITIARFAFLTPLPGGLGVLEASQVLALSAMGYSGAEGLSVALLIRARDLAFGGVGLLLGSSLLGQRPTLPEKSAADEGNS